jgi:acetyltransferase-like isoleucine patch superfamily enzyme
VTGDIRIGKGLVADEDVTVGYSPSRPVDRALVLGRGARLRSGTVIYLGSRVGSGFETGHHVVVREGATIGDDVSIWSNTVVDYGCRLGDRVKVHCNCYLAQFTELEDDVFLAPGVTVANDLFPGLPESAAAMAGPRIEAGAQVGVNVTILPYVTIGAGAIIGAGSVVTRDVPAGFVAFGNPAVPGRRVTELGDVTTRVRAAWQSRMAASRPPVLGDDDRQEVPWRSRAASRARG